MNLVQKGADIIDIGGQSTKPNFDDISSELEKNRIKKTLKSMKNYSNVIFSIDTRKANVADYALNKGATIFNDVSSLEFDPESIKIVKKHKCFVCLNA